MFFRQMFGNKWLFAFMCYGFVCLDLLIWQSFISDMQHSDAVVVFQIDIELSKCCCTIGVWVGTIGSVRLGQACFPFVGLIYKFSGRSV